MCWWCGHTVTEVKEVNPTSPLPSGSITAFPGTEYPTKLVNKQYLAITLLEAPLLALIVALLTRYVDGDEYTLLANKNFVSYIFMSVIVVTFMGLSISAEEIIKRPACPEAGTFPPVKP